MEVKTTAANYDFRKVAFIILLLFSIHFWDLRYIPQKYNIENVLTWLACGFSLLMVIHRPDLKFKYAILLFILGLLMNIIPAFINYGQSPRVTILAFAYEYFILMYFLCHYFKFSIKFLENIIVVFAIIYSLIYVIQAKIYPYPIITNGLNLDAGMFQFEIIGHGFLVLAYLLMVNRYLIYSKLLNLVAALGFLMVLMMCGFRTLIAGALVVTVIMFIRTFRFDIKNFALIIIASLLFVGIFQFQGVSSILEKSINITKSNLDEGERYIRLRQLEYFYTEYPKNITYFILGGGKLGGDNIYKAKMSSLGQNYNIVWVDLGILGFYIVIGAIATLGLLWYTFRAIFIKLPQRMIYLNFYFLYLLIVSFTNAEIYQAGIFSVHAICLYLIDTSVTEGSDSRTIALVPKTQDETITS